MGAKQTTVGGGGATGVSNQWNSFLGQQLGQNPEQQSIANQIQGLQKMRGSLPKGVNHSGIDARIASLQGQMGSGGEGSAQPSQFQQLFNNAAGGGVNDPSGAFAQLQQMISGGGNTSPQFQNPYQSQQYNNPNIQQLDTNLFQGQNGMANLNGVGGVKPTNVDVMQGFGGQQGGTGFDSQLMQMIQQMQGGGMQAGAAGTSLDPARQVDLNDPLVAAQQAGIDRQKMVDVANLRARFGAEGAGAMGTGAQVAESTLAAEYAPKSAAILQDAIRFQQQQDLQERQAKAGVGLQSNAQALQASMANAGNAAQGSQGILNALISGRGQDLQQMIQNRGMDISQLGMGLNQAQGNQGAALTQRGQDLSSLLQNQGQGNQFALGAAGINQNNAQANNQNSLQAANQQNGFNLSNAGNNAQFQHGTNQLNAGQGQFDQSQLMQMIQMGLGQNNFGQAGQNQLMQMLFGAMGQSNGLGTPQAQTLMQPSPWMELAQGGLGLANSWMNTGGKKS